MVVAVVPVAATVVVVVVDNCCNCGDVMMADDDDGLLFDEGVGELSVVLVVIIVFDGQSVGSEACEGSRGGSRGGSIGGFGGDTREGEAGSSGGI